MCARNLNSLCVKYQMSYQFIKNTENVINILLKEKKFFSELGKVCVIWKIPKLTKSLFV